jgi:enoyl-CoA hydratase/carnithine racemase
MPRAEFATLEAIADSTVGRLTLDRPEKLNPLGAATLQELVDAARWFDDQPDVRVVIVSGRGRAFSAGADLASFSGTEANEGRSPHEAADLGRQLVEAVEGMRAVTVAAIHGHCVGGALLLALACDLRLAAEDTSFAIPEIELGIPLTWGGIPRLVREVGPAVTRDLVLTGRRFPAAEALALGLVNRVVAADDLPVEAEALAELLATRSPLTLTTTLRQVDEAAEALVSTADSEADADLLVEALQDPDSRAVATDYLSRLRKH